MKICLGDEILRSELENYNKDREFDTVPVTCSFTCEKIL